MKALPHGQDHFSMMRSTPSFGPECINVTAHSLRRSVNFYSLALGFELVGVAPLGTGRRVLMSFADQCHLSIRERAGGYSRHAPSNYVCTLLVDDLDRLRQNLWDSGVALSRDSGMPDQIYRSSTVRTLYVRDPDANEIELVELRGARQVRWR